MKVLFAVLRIAAAAASIAAIVATTADAMSRTVINPFNLYGYFTTQSNIIYAVACMVAAIVGLRGRRQSSGVLLFRASATTYIVVVGIVYNTLLAGQEGGVVLPWANTVLHIIVPLYAAVDWILFADRGPVPWNRFWWVLLYPLVWLAVVLIRGATDGWVPYPFLNPSQGYGVVTLYCVGIAVAIGVVALGVWAVSRTRIIKTTLT